MAWNTPPGYMPPIQNWGNTYTSQQPQAMNNWQGNNVPVNPVSIVPISGGRPAAEDYPVAPGAKVVLVDPSELVTYVKERDAQGRSMSFLVYDWVIREEPKPDQNGGEIDYEKIRSMISEEVRTAMNRRNKNFNKKENG